MRVLLLLFGFVATATRASIVRDPTEQYNHTLTLDKEGNYELFWKYNDTHVTFEVHVQTRGYIGFGLSPTGNMFPSDVVVGWVKDGQTYFKDYHTVAKAPPVEDRSQDWFLLFSEENGVGTVLKFVRKIDTCDDNDIAINDATQRLIFSYHTDDPVDEQHLMYHGAKRRGTKSIALLNQQLPRQHSKGDNIRMIDIRPNNIIIPSSNTTYMCIGFQMPDLGGKHHMIQYEPLVTPGNEELIHHLTIQRCQGNHPALHGATTECFYAWPKDWPTCPEQFIAWATGGGAFYFPEEAGYPVGGPNDYPFYVMQVHYNNPSRRSGVIDSSGIRMHLTSSLRKHDIGMLIVGYQVGDSQVIPPQMPSFISSGYCDGNLLAKRMEAYGVSEVKAIASLQHAHLLGYGITTRHFRNGTELKPIADDPYYDFYFQEFRDLKEVVTIKKGDSLRVDCNYKSMSRQNVTFGGLSTLEEMCESFLYVYPSLDIQACASYTAWNSIFKNFSYTYAYHEDFRDFINSATDWTNKTERDHFVQVIKSLPSLHMIVGKPLNGSGYYFDSAFYRDVDNYTPYTPVDNCKTMTNIGQTIVG